MFDSLRIKTSPEFPGIVKLLGALKAAGYPAICTGGFPRDVGLGETYKDIDVFVQTRNENKSTQDRVLGIQQNCQGLGIFREKFQLICVPCDDIVEYTTQLFDFTCCLVYIDYMGHIFTPGGTISLSSKVLEFINPTRDSFDSLKSAQHCLRLLAKGWTASALVVKALVKTLVPVVSAQTYTAWKIKEEMLNRILSEQFSVASVEHQPIVPMREYSAEMPAEGNQQSFGPWDTTLEQLWNPTAAFSHYTITRLDVLLNPNANPSR